MGPTRLTGPRDWCENIPGTIEILWNVVNFSEAQWAAIVVIFVWTGFVRSGIGFGGAALGLPLLLLVEEAPLFFLPIIGIHLLVFTSLTAGGRLRNIDWRFVRGSMGWMIVPKIAGVVGLLSLPTRWMVVFVFSVTAAYAISWIARREIRSESVWLDRLLLVVGGYISGASLVGAPLIAAVAIHKVDLKRYRDTLFVLWFLLVTIKMTAFKIAGVDLQWQAALMLLGPAAVGHVIGLRFHDRLVGQSAGQVKRWLGVGLLAVSAIGLLL